MSVLQGESSGFFAFRYYSVFTESRRKAWKIQIQIFPVIVLVNLSNPEVCEYVIHSVVGLLEAAGMTQEYFIICPRPGQVIIRILSWEVKNRLPFIKTYARCSARESFTDS